MLASSNEKNTGPTPGPWMIVPPGGPQGPFYGLINSQGNVVATQIVGEANARLSSDYDCPDCRAQQAQTLAEQFTAAELARLRFWQWMRLTGRAGS